MARPSTLAPSPRDVVVLGASAGGVEALMGLAAKLPADLPGALLVVLHVPPSGSSVLPSILTRSGPLPAHHALDGEKIEHGVVYVAPPDQHLLVEDGQVRLWRGPRENGHRPAIDPLFRSASRSFGPRLVAVVLSGALDDGTAGMQAVKARGGVTIAQDPTEAHYPSMPLSAIQAVTPDLVLTVAEIARFIDRLAREHVAAGAALSEDAEMDDELRRLEIPAAAELAGGPAEGSASGFTCPDCGGALWEIEDGKLVRFRCRVGHAYSSDSLFTGQADSLETALWAALRALEERASLGRRLAERLRSRGHRSVAARYEREAVASDQRAAVVREALRGAPAEEHDELAEGG